MTIIVTQINDWLNLRNTLGNKTIGFIPTMGNLHAGHLSLCSQSIQENDVSVVSVFVNPTQFNQTADFDNYPRTQNEDIAQLKSQRVDYVLMFNAEQLYPDNYEVQVTENALSQELEGEFRPGHFDGMLTIVLKFLNLVRANRAYFGEKDYQQLLLVKKMVSALFIPTQIVGCSTIRTTQDLALSSRNNRLKSHELQKAEHFPRILKQNISLDQVKEQLTDLGFKVDYIAEKWQRRLGAVWLGDVRLIDNVPIGGE